jgi:hypothetical protein
MTYWWVKKDILIWFILVGCNFNYCFGVQGILSSFLHMTQCQCWGLSSYVWIHNSGTICWKTVLSPVLQHPHCLCHTLALQIFSTWPGQALMIEECGEQGSGRRRLLTQIMSQCRNWNFPGDLSVSLSPFFSSLSLTHTFTLMCLCAYINI